MGGTRFDRSLTSLCWCCCFLWLDVDVVVNPVVVGGLRWAWQGVTGLWQVDVTVDIDNDFLLFWVCCCQRPQMGGTRCDRSVTSQRPWNYQWEPNLDAQPDRQKKTIYVFFLFDFMLEAGDYYYTDPRGSKKCVCLPKQKKRKEGGRKWRKGTQGSTVTTIVTTIINPLSTAITIGIHPHRLHQHQWVPHNHHNPHHLNQ